jgi:hypothetical protein
LFLSSIYLFYFSYFKNTCILYGQHIVVGIKASTLVSKETIPIFSKAFQLHNGLCLVGSTINYGFIRKDGCFNLTPTLFLVISYNVVYYEETNFKMTFVVAMKMGFGIAKTIV